MLEMARLHLSDAGARTARDPQRLHGLLMRAFPADVGGRAGAGLLYRVESESTVLAQYVIAADWAAVGEGVAAAQCRDVEVAHAAVVAGHSLRFLLHANATFDGVVDGKRRRTGLRAPEQQLAWLDRKLAGGGARIVTADGIPQVRVGETWQQRGRRAGGRMTHQGVSFQGRLVVDDPDVFRAVLRAGVGRGKAYGFGLLTVAP